MSKFCPLIKERVIYQFCEDCDERLCKGEIKEKEEEKKKEKKEKGESK